MAGPSDGAPTPPAYPVGPPGADIDLYVGRLTVGERPATGRVWLGTRGGLDHRWEAELDDGLAVSLGDTVLGFVHPTLGAVTAAARVTSSAGLGVLLSPAMGGGGPLDSVVAHWVALPALPGSTRLATTRAVWSGRCALKGGGWRMTLDARHDRDTLEAAALGTPDLAVTHTGRLERLDGAPFTPEEAEEALYAWQTVLSFSLGRWVAPTLAVGSLDGRPRWELWSDWRQSGWYRPYSWWNTHDRAALDEISRLLMEAWADRARQDAVRHVAHHVIEANEPRTTLEARIMLVGAALEFLSWDTYVLRGGRGRSRQRERSAADNLRELLEDARIDTSVPADLNDLERIRTDERHPEALAGAPEAIAWLRNRLVHPKDANEPYRLRHLVLQAWQLLIEYGELLLLHDLGYTGSHNSRHPLGRWAHDSNPVPWASEASSP
ncbi:MAG: hypothetical protein JWO60_3436 [Frankiales bacterium]|nr:hypothetical protein [Frankiales bacterium]